MSFATLVRVTSLLFLWFPSSFIQAQQTRTFSIYYANDSASISLQNAATISAQFETMDSIPIRKVEIISSASFIGTEDYNQKLSETRANTLRNFIAALYPDTAISIDVKGIGAKAKEYASTAEEQADRKSIVTIVYDTLVKEAPEPEPAKRLSGELKIGDKVILENILFEGGRHVLLPESLNDLDSLTQFVLNNPKYQLMILGHICCQEPDQDGHDFDTGLMNLSVARAKMIYDHLIENGAIKERIDYRGMKANYPTGNGARADRRVEIEIIGIYPD